MTTEKCETCNGTGLLNVERDEHGLQVGPQEPFCPSCDSSGHEQMSKDLVQRAQDMAEDPSRTATEWLEWLKVQLIGDQPPINIVG